MAANRRLLSYILQKCQHQATDVQCLKQSFSVNETVGEIFDDLHPFIPPNGKTHTCTAWAQVGAVTFKVTVGELVDNFQIRSLQFKCEVKDEYLTADATGAAIAKYAESVTRKTVDAFQVLMVGGRSFVLRKNRLVVVLSIPICAY